MAKVLTDSVSPSGERLTTLIFKGPKFIDAEFEKHGNICSNGSSSRARSFPVCGDDIYLPERVQAPAKSMHGTEEVSEVLLNEFRSVLGELYVHTVDTVGRFKNVIHKQHLNRYVEAFTWQTKVATANAYAWDNFLELRLAEYADPAIQILAERIRDAIAGSTPVEAHAHCPFDDDPYVSAGIIARVSYDRQGEQEDWKVSQKRADTLIENGHKTPFEHQARCVMRPTPQQFLDDPEKYRPAGWTHTDGAHMYSGRLRGWAQQRKLIWNGLDEK